MDVSLITITNRNKSANIRFPVSARFSRFAGFPTPILKWFPWKRG